MRATLAPEVERCRVSGEPGSGPHGAFRLIHPNTGRTLNVIISDGRGWERENLPPPPWEHVSVSTRLSVPRWEEMCWIRDVFFLPEEWVVQFHPAEADYINVHSHVLHLWRVVGGQFPTPPKACV